MFVCTYRYLTVLNSYLTVLHYMKDCMVVYNVRTVPGTLRTYHTSVQVVILIHGKENPSLMEHGPSNGMKKVLVPAKTKMRSQRYKVWSKLAFFLLLWTVVLSSVTSSKYEWEEWNYYDILGLADNTKKSKKKSRRRRMSERNKITVKEIKKAYRREAQLWHPDKWASRSNSTKASVEECTARFSKIAEAYEVLTNERDRLEYDIYLLDEEDKYETDNLEQENKSFFQKFAAKDPRKIFEDFFFGEDSFPTHVFQTLHDFLQDDPPKQQKQTSEEFYSHPIRVTESTQIRYDARLGRDVHRILHREEYYSSETQIYYRIIAQEFVQQDPYYYQQETEFVAVSEPYLLEDGFESVQSSQPRNKKQSSTQKQKQNYRQLLSHESSILDSSEYITPTSQYFLRSSNKKYYAGLTPDCELVVMMESHDQNDDKLVWTSNSYLPPSFTNYDNTQCFLALYNSRLAVVVGPDVDHPLSVLWNSPTPYQNIKKLFHKFHHRSDKEELEYYVSLDNDGSLTIYQIRSSLNENKSSLGEKLFSWWNSIQNHPDLHTTRAAAAWNSVRSWAVHNVLKIRISNNDSKKKDECIFSTSIVGCFTPGRQVLQMGTNVKESLGKQIDGFVELLQVHEEDEDILDTFSRIVGNVGQAVGKASIRMAKKSARDIRVVSNIVCDLVREQVRFFQNSIKQIEHPRIKT